MCYFENAFFDEVISHFEDSGIELEFSLKCFCGYHLTLVKTSDNQRKSMLGMIFSVNKVPSHLQQY